MWLGRRGREREALEGERRSAPSCAWRLVESGLRAHPPRTDSFSTAVAMAFMMFEAYLYRLLYVIIIIEWTARSLQ